MIATQPMLGPSVDSLRTQASEWWSHLDRGWKAAVLGFVIAATELALSLP